MAWTQDIEPYDHTSILACKILEERSQEAAPEGLKSQRFDTHRARGFPAAI